MCREIITRAPDLALAHTFLGAALGHQGRLLEALECHRRAAELSPQDPKSIETYASMLTDVGRFIEGLRWFSRSLRLNPRSSSARQTLGPALLRHGCIAEGWVEYGYRETLVRFQEKHPQIALSRTLPVELGGSHICVLQEQGLGDEIFFLRYAPQLNAAGARVTCRASNKIRSLLARVPGIEQVLEESAAPPAADAIMLAGDLPHASSVFAFSSLPSTDISNVEVRLQNFPSRISVFWPQVPPPLALTPLDEQIAKLRRRLAEIGDPPYLGLTWRGGIPPHEQRGVVWGLYKEIGIRPFAAAVQEFPGTFLALQRNPAPGELAELENLLGRRVYDFTALNEDLEGMLALLALIDEYIGVSNTNMHLRAGVGKTGRVLVACPAEWRWMDAGRSSPWFPGFPIYRQSPRGDWDTALADLKRDLAQTNR